MPIEWLNMIFGDEVAVMPGKDSLPDEVLEIQCVDAVGLLRVRVRNDRWFAIFGGIGMNSPGFIVPATPCHNLSPAGHPERLKRYNASDFLSQASDNAPQVALRQTCGGLAQCLFLNPATK